MKVTIKNAIIVLLVLMIIYHMHKNPINCTLSTSLNDVGCDHSDIVLQLYPDSNYCGWDNSGYNSTLNVWLADAAWHKDSNGKKEPVVIMKKENGVETYYYNSLKICPGTSIIVTCIGIKTGTAVGKYTGNKNISNISTMAKLIGVDDNVVVSVNV